MSIEIAKAPAASRGGHGMGLRRNTQRGSRALLPESQQRGSKRRRLPRASTAHNDRAQAPSVQLQPGLLPAHQEAVERPWSRGWTEERAMSALSSCLTVGGTQFTKTCLNKSVSAPLGLPEAA